MRLTCWLAAAVMAALAAAPTHAQNRMSVTPTEVRCAPGESVTLTVKTDRGRGWQVDGADQWHTLVEPQTLGRVEIRGGKLVFVAARTTGKGKLHVWHKTRLSYAGLYVVLKIHVEAGTARPRPTPGGLAVYRMDTSPPTRISGGPPIPVVTGQRLPLMVTRDGDARVPVALSVGATPGVRVLQARGQRALLELTAPAAGTRVQVATRCGRTGLSTVLRFLVVKPTRAVGIRTWFRVGLDGPWSPLPPGATIVVPPGGVAFLSAEPVDATRRPIDRPVQVGHTDDESLAVRHVGGKVWILAAGRPRRIGQTRDLGLQAGALRRTVRVQIGG